MGRYPTGVITTGQAQRLELSYLLRNGFIEKGKVIHGRLYWTSGSSINYESDLSCPNPVIRLIYNNTKYNGEITHQDYMIHFALVPSNLGNGNVLYFICPVTNTKCRILYKCYGSSIWKSHQAYPYRIYYQCQISSKFNHYLDRYWETENKLEQLYFQVVKSHYRGRKTALQRRIEYLENKREYYDWMRWRILHDSIHPS